MTNQITLSKDNTTAYVTKEFMKKSLVFGSEEYKMVRELKKELPNIEVTTRVIKKNPDKVTFKNLTYDNMASYIETLPNKEQLLHEFEIAKVRAKIAKNPYRSVMNWFKSNCFDNDSEFDGYRVAQLNTAKTEVSSESAIA